MRSDEEINFFDNFFDGSDDESSLPGFGDGGSFPGFGDGGSPSGYDNFDLNDDDLSSFLFYDDGSSPGDDYSFLTRVDSLNAKRERQNTGTFPDSGTGAPEGSSIKRRKSILEDLEPTFLSPHQLDQVIGNYNMGFKNTKENVYAIAIQLSAKKKVCRYQKFLKTFTLGFSITSADPSGERAEGRKLIKRDVIMCPLENEWKNNRTKIRFVEFSNGETIDNIFSVSKSENVMTTVFEYGTGLILYHLLKDVCPFFPEPKMLFSTTFKDAFPSIWKSNKPVGFEEPFMVATEPVITFETLKVELTKIVNDEEKIGELRVGKILKSILLQGLLAIRLLELKSFGSNGLNPSHIGFVKAKKGDNLSFELNYPLGAEEGKGKARIIDVFKGLDDDDKYILTFLMNPINEDPYSAWNIYTDIMKPTGNPEVIETEEDVENVFEDDDIVLVPDVTKPQHKRFLATGSNEMLHGFAYAFTTLVLSVSNGGDYSTILSRAQLSDGSTALSLLELVKKNYLWNEQLAEYIIEKTLLFGPLEGDELSTGVEKISEVFGIRTAYEESFERLGLFYNTGKSIYDVLREMSSWKRSEIPSAKDIISKLTVAFDNSRDHSIAGEKWIVMRRYKKRDYPNYVWTSRPNMLGATGGKFIGKRIPFGRFQIPFTPQAVKMSKLICSSLLSILPQRKRNDAGKMVKTTRKKEPVSPIFII
jgi:hypothetical protein